VPPAPNAVAGIASARSAKPGTRKRKNRKFHPLSSAGGVS
jgi:hypothetical protein